MSERITGELRLFLADPYREWEPKEKKDKELKDTLDAIDAVHANLERENDRLKCELDRVLGELDDMHKTDGISDNSGGFMQNTEHHAWAPESHYVMLPKDADGVPIHIGDVMDSKVDYLFDGKPFTVRGLVLCEDGWEVTDGRFGNRYKPDSLRHHHEPTVEDVLRGVVTLCRNTWKEGSAFEFYDVDDVMKSGNIAEYAAKLRLAGDAE